MWGAFLYGTKVPIWIQTQPSRFGFKIQVKSIKWRSWGFFFNGTGNALTLYMRGCWKTLLSALPPSLTSHVTHMVHQHEKRPTLFLCLIGHTIHQGQWSSEWCLPPRWNTRPGLSQWTIHWLCVEEILVSRVWLHVRWPEKATHGFNKRPNYLHNLSDVQTCSECSYLWSGQGLSSLNAVTACCQLVLWQRSNINKSNQTIHWIGRLRAIKCRKSAVDSHSVLCSVRFISGL